MVSLTSLTEKNTLSLKNLLPEHCRDPVLRLRFRMFLQNRDSSYATSWPAEPQCDSLTKAIEYCFTYSLSMACVQDCLRQCQEQIEESLRNSLTTSSSSSTSDQQQQQTSKHRSDTAAAAAQPLTPTDVRDVVIDGQ